MEGITVFQEGIGGQNTTIYAFLKPLDSIPEDYAIKQIKEPVQFMQDYMGWAVYTRKETDPVRIKFTEQVAQYNCILQAICDTPGFIDFFNKNELIISKEQIEQEFSAELADLVFSMGDYEFIHQLNVKGNYLFDRLRVEYDYSIEQSENSIVIENRSDDLRDATFLLCLQLEKDGLMPDVFENDFEWFECYDQARDDLDEPDGRVLRIIELLNSNGFLNEYLIEIDPSQPVISSDYPMEVFVLNLDYKENDVLKQRIKNMLRVGIFGGTSGVIQTYALVSVCDDDTDKLNQYVNDENGNYISLNDGTGIGMIFNLSADQIIKLICSFDVDTFIYGNDYISSTAYLYKKTTICSFKSTPLKTICSMKDLEEIAPDCSDVWEDLYFNDYFKECLWSHLQ